MSLAKELSWKDDESAFEVLPLLVQSGFGRPSYFYEVPEDAVLEVPLTHPRHRDSQAWACAGTRCLPSVTCLGDRWWQLSGGTLQRLVMGTEIGSRTLGDTDRYSLLPAVAALFGLDARNDCTLWRDRALVGLSLAVV